MGQTLLEGEEALEEVLDWEAGLQALHARIALRFSRSESRQRILAYPCLHRGRLCKDCWGRWSARMDGSWPNTLGTPRPMECSGCWRCTTGMRTRFGTTPVFTGAGSARVRGGASGRSRRGAGSG